MTDKPDTEAAAMRRRIEQLLTADLAPLVAAYFDPDGPYAADTFNTLGANHPFRFEGDDIAAVGLLDVSVPSRVVRVLVTGAMNDRLQAIDHEVALWEASDAVLDAANALWQALHDFHGVGPVIAGKLLARKRPALIPIYDEVVGRVLEPPPGRFWHTLRDVLAHPTLRDRIEELRPDEVDARVPLLRLLDVAVWMSDGRSGNARTTRSAAAQDPQ